MTRWPFGEPVAFRVRRLPLIDPDAPTAKKHKESAKPAIPKPVGRRRAKSREAPSDRPTST